MTESVTMTFPPNNGTNGSYLTTDGNGNLVWTDPAQQDDFVMDAGGAATQLAVFEGSNTITGTALYYDSANSFLGIGVPNPTQALDVSGNINVSGNATFTDVIVEDLTGSGVISAPTGSFTNLFATSSLNVGDDFNAGQININDGNGNNLIIQAPTGMGGDVTFTMPANNGSNGQVLTTDGNGSLSWTTVQAGAGTVDTDGSGAVNKVALWSNASTLTSSANLFYNTSANMLGVNNPSPSFTLDVNGGARLGNNGTSGSLTFYSEQGGSDFEITLSPSNQMTANLNFTLPNSYGNEGEVLRTNGSGEMYWDGGSVYGISNLGPLAADQNNLVVDLTTTIIRINATSNINLSGIDATDAVDGQKLIIISVGTNRVRIQNENVSSLAANRFISGGNIDLFTNGLATFIYDATTQRWRLVSTN